MRVVCKIVILLLLTLDLVACTSVPKQSSINPHSLSTKSSENKDDLSAFDFQASKLPQGNIWDEFRRNLALPDGTRRPEVQSQIRWFQKHQGYLNRAISHGAPYIYFLYQETEQLHLPAELALIPLHESDYNPFCYSHAGANGLWQLMPGTASGFGLKINRWYDGRRDIVASTHAALKYITYLHYFFNNDWLLAIAAYNAGEGKVQAAIMHNERRNLPTDFWSLRLPHETHTYVPRLLALAAIFKDPDRYGIKLLPVNNAPYFAEVDVGKQIDIRQAAKFADVDVETMRMLNPGLRRSSSDPDGPYTLLVPADRVDSFKQKLSEPEENSEEATSELTTEKNSTIAEERIPGPKQVVYTVKTGDTLASVAKKYGVKAHQVAYWNQLNENATVTDSDELVIWLEHGKTAKHAVAKSSVYKVKPGDSLALIAKRFHISSKQLMSNNNLHSSRLKIGQKLRVPGSASHRTTAKKKSKHRSVHHKLSTRKHKHH